MYKSRLIYLAIVLASFVFSQALYESISFMTLIIALLLPVLSVVLSVMSYPLISVKLTVSETDVKRFSRFKGIISIINRSPFTSPTFKITCTVPNESGVKTEQVIFALNSSFARQGAFEYECFFANRGMYDVSVDVVEYYDFLKLIKVRKKMNQKISVRSNPRDIKLLLPVSSEQQYQENSNLVGTSTVLSGGDMIGVREYVYGDNVKNMHWKLSTKADELIMKTFAEDVYDQAYVIADMSSYYEDVYMNKSFTDCVVEAAIAAIRAYASNSIRFSLIVNTGKSSVVKYPIVTPNDLFEAEKAISVAPMINNTDITDTLKNINFSGISGCEVCIITSFRSDDILKNIRKILLSQKTNLHVVNITESEQGEKNGVVTYTRDYIEKQNTNK